MEIADIESLLTELNRKRVPNRVQATEVKYWGEGKTRPWIVNASDKNQYVVKVQNNPEEGCVLKVL